MSEEVNQIQHHQRILITGTRAYEILAICLKVLDAQSKPYDILTDQEQSITDGSIVFIISASLKNHDPHIVLVDTVTNEQKEQFRSLVDGLPKSGTLVYNSSDANAKEIGEKELEDVHKEKYTDEDSNSSARALIRRIGINEEIFNKSL